MIIKIRRIALNKVITSLLVIISSNNFAQERIGSFKNDLKKGVSFVKDIIPIVNSKNNDVAVFVADAKNVYGYKLNDKFKVTSKITSEEKRRKYRTLLGYSIPNENNYKIILTNKNKKKFLIVDFSFSEQTSRTKEFVLEDSSEKIVQTLSVDNKFYLITAKPYAGSYYSETGIRLNVSFDNDLINFYSFDEKNNLIKKEINLSEQVFLDEDGERIMVRSLLLPRFDGEISKIDTSVSNPIDITSNTTKFYYNTNKANFSFDKNNELTQVLEINLEDFTVKQDSFQKHLTKAKRSNSFFYEDNVVIASANKKELHLKIVNIQSKKVLKEFSISEGKDIEFKNSPIIQRGGAYSSYRELKTAKQFLRKITTDKFGITIFKTNNKYELSIGGYSIQQNGGGMMMGGMGAIPIGVIGGASMFFNPTMFAYNSSSSTKSTQIDCLLDESFEHIEGKIPENSFDKIDEFLETNGNPYGEKGQREDDNDITEVFKLNSETILGSYDKSLKMYYFYKF